MVNPVAVSAAEAEYPKAASKSSSARDAGGSGSRTSFAYYRHEELAMKWTSKDGDTMEIRGSYTFAAAYAMKPYQGRLAEAGEEEGCRKGPAGQGPGCDKTDVMKGGLEGMAEWAKDAEAKLRKMLLEQLEKALKGEDRDRGVWTGDGRYMRILSVEYAELAEETQSTEEEAGVPEFWNAENTSQRIVDFATSFAGIHGGDDPGGFAETITNAVLEGFRLAANDTGELPGAAGKLNRDTKELTLSKLEKWLDQWRNGSYNQNALLSENEPAAVA